ncbi:MAG: pilus assembly protein [Anaerolineae bacterium]|nr:pilus assembly protein [Anaerolineae bacterium]
MSIARLKHLLGRDKKSGQGLVEFAATLFVLVLFIMTILDFGRGIYAYSSISAAAQAGARQGIIDPTDTASIQQAVLSNTIGLDSSKMSINISQPDTDTVEVSVTYDFLPITPLIEQAIGNNGHIHLHAAAAMRRY